MSDTAKKEEETEIQMETILDQDSPSAQRRKIQDLETLYNICDEFEKKYQEQAEKNDQLLRAYADAENTKKRVLKDRDDAVKYASVKMARDILDIADNLRRALDSIDETQKEQVKNFVEGVEITERYLLQVFSRYNIHPISPKDEKFDPNFHEAIAEIPMPDKEDGDIIDVVQVGYKLEDRLLRPAKVVVTKKD